MLFLIWRPARILLPLFVLLLVGMDSSPACVHVNPWIWSERQLLGGLWVLGTEPTSSGRAVSALDF